MSTGKTAKSITLNKCEVNPDHPIHDETVLANAYIEELAVRHNIQVLNFDGISRGHFTRHGQHLSIRGKRLLARMLTPLLDKPLLPPPLVTAPVVATSPAIDPAAALPAQSTPPTAYIMRHETYLDAVINGLPSRSQVKPALPRTQPIGDEINWTVPHSVPSFLGTPPANNRQN